MATALLAGGLLPAAPARAVDDLVTGACAALGVRDDDLGSPAVVDLWVAAPSRPGVIGTFATCTVVYGGGRTLTFGVSAIGPVAATAVRLEDAAPSVYACARVGALWVDGHVVTRDLPCSYTEL